MKRLLVLIAACVMVLFCAYAALGSDTRPASGSPEPAARQNDSARVDAFWSRALQETYKSPAELQAQHDRELGKGIRYLKLIRGSSRRPDIALTFDDGPHPDYTPKILDILKRYRAKATFFVVGKLAEQYPDLIKAELADGHVLGNHIYHHVNLTKIPVNEIAAEWQACEDAIKRETGVTMRYGRPPGGDYDRDVILAAADAGLTTVLWTDDPGDYANPGGRTIETLHSRGFHFVTIPELAGEVKLGRR